MARSINRLSARTVASLKVPGKYADGVGLYLEVDTGLAKRWTFLFQWHGQRKQMGLGSAATVSLAEARDQALAARKLVQSGVNPIEARRDDRAGKTFGDVADEVLASLLPSMSNRKHRGQWTTALKKSAASLSPKRVDEVTTQDVLNVLRPVWTRTPETASRLRGRIERVLDAAKAKGLRSGENPARWRGHLDVLLPRQINLVQGHHAAMPYEALPQFLAALRTRPAVSARALEFTILTGARTGETLGMRWSEVNEKEAVWNVPAHRMKARAAHRVPLTPVALSVLDRVRPFRGNEPDALVFPGQRGAQLSDMSMMMLMRRMEQDAFTVHGFRSTFRDWAGDCTNFARELIEASLAHAIGNAVERAYRRSDAFAKRRRLMEAWAGYCTKVVVSSKSLAA